MNSLVQTLPNRLQAHSSQPALSSHPSLPYNLQSTQTGVLLAKKAPTPSFIFCPPSILSHPPSTTLRVASPAPSPSHPPLNPSFVTTTASGEHLATTSPANPNASSTALPSPTTKFTSPHRRISSAVYVVRPSSAISDARCRPTIRVSRGSAPATATTPTVTSGSPKRARPVGHQHVAADGHLEAAAEADAVDGGDEGLARAVEGVVGEAAEAGGVEEGFALFGGWGRRGGGEGGVPLDEVGAGAKGARAGAGEDGAAEGGLGVVPGPEGGEEGVVRGGEGVEAGRAVEGDEEDVGGGEGEEDGWWEGGRGGGEGWLGHGD